MVAIRESLDLDPLFRDIPTCSNVSFVTHWAFGPWRVGPLLCGNLPRSVSDSNLAAGARRPEFHLVFNLFDRKVFDCSRLRFPYPQRDIPLIHRTFAQGVCVAPLPRSPSLRPILAQHKGDIQAPLWHHPEARKPSLHHAPCAEDRRDAREDRLNILFFFPFHRCFPQQELLQGRFHNHHSTAMLCHVLDLFVLGFAGFAVQKGRITDLRFTQVSFTVWKSLCLKLSRLASSTYCQSKVASIIFPLLLSG